MVQLSMLIVDDDPDHADLLAELLVESGHEALVARCAAEALAIVEYVTFDLVLVDLGLPDEHGSDLVARLRARGLRCRIVATTGFGGAEVKDRALKSGVDAFVMKPFGLAKISAEIAHVISSAKVTSTD